MDAADSMVAPAPAWVPDAVTPPDRPDTYAPDRSRGYDPAYSLALHLLRVAALAALFGGIGAALVRGAPAWHWWLVPAFWIVANFVEWTAHRYPMHKPLRPRILYTNHTLTHHRAFRGKRMEIETTTDLCLVMMPWYSMAMVFLGAAPLFVAAGLLFGASAAGMTILGGLSYFLLYETIHTLHHLPRRRPWRGGPVGRFITWLRAHHHHHHQLKRMAHVNFNVTLPLADAVLGTYETPPPEEPRTA